MGKGLNVLMFMTIFNLLIIVTGNGIGLNNSFADSFTTFDGTSTQLNYNDSNSGLIDAFPKDKVTTQQNTGSSDNNFIDSLDILWEIGLYLFNILFAFAPFIAGLPDIPSVIVYLISTIFILIYAVSLINWYRNGEF